MSRLSVETCNPQAFGTRHSLTPLQIACKNGGTVALIPPYEKRCNGHLDIVKLILGRIGETLPKNKENFKRTDFETFNLAAFSGNLEIFQCISTAYGHEINPPDPYSNNDTPLHVAAWTSQYAICEFILQNVVDKSPKNLKGKTPLNVAEMYNNDSIVDLIKSYTKKE